MNSAPFATRAAAESDKPFVLSLSKYERPLETAPFGCLPAVAAQDRLPQAQGERSFV